MVCLTKKNCSCYIKDNFIFVYACIKIFDGLVTRIFNIVESIIFLKARAGWNQNLKFCEKKMTRPNVVVAKRTGMVFILNRTVRFRFSRVGHFELFLPDFQAKMPQAKNPQKYKSRANTRREHVSYNLLVSLITHSYHNFTQITQKRQSTMKN